MRSRARNAILTASLAVASGCRPVPDTTILSPGDSASNYAAERCRQGEGKACGLLAQRFFEGEGVPKDRARAMLYASLACQKRDPLGCGYWGSFLATRKDYGGNMDQVVADLELGCSHNVGFACGQLANMLWRHTTLAGGRARALGLAEKSCHLGFPAFCYLLGRFYEEGAEGPPAPDRAVEWFRTACNQGWPEGCAEVAWYGKKPGSGVSDEERVWSQHEACKGGLMESCVDEALDALEPKATSCSELVAKHVAAACTAGVLDGCAVAAKCQFLGGKNTVAILRSHCTSGSALGCLYLSQQLRDAPQSSAPPSEWQAPLSKMCSLAPARGWSQGCLELAGLLLASEKKDDLQRAAQALGQMCTEVPAACFKLGQMYEQGLLFAPDVTEATRHYDLACKGTFREACEARDRLKIAPRPTASESSQR